MFWRPSTFDAVRRRYEKLSRAWGPEAGPMPAHRQRQDDGSAHLEFARGRYALVVTERGEECSRRETGDIDELLYWLFASAAWSRGWDYELAHRHPTQDSRRIGFAAALDAIGQISPLWRERMGEEQARILAKHPFRDGGIGNP